MHAHMRRKAHEWRRSYAGLTPINRQLIRECEKDGELSGSPFPEDQVQRLHEQQEQEERMPLGEISGN
jgi:hypothetical protein